MSDDIEYPPRQQQPTDAKFQSKHQCGLCQRPLPFSPFSGIGWRDVILESGKRTRTRICNECYISWRKANPISPRSSNIKLWNRVVSIGALVLALYGLWAFTQTGLTNWMDFLTGPAIVLIVGGMFLYIFYGIINKRIEFAVPSAQDKSKKPNWNFNFPNPAHAESILQPKAKEEATKDINDVPSTLNFEESHTCDICGLEKQEQELFVHPNGFKICNDCIVRKKHYETNHN